MPENLIIIGAGVKNVRKISDQYQMFLEIDGRRCFEIILDQVVRLAGAPPVYLWGSEDILGELLGRVMHREKDRREIVLVPERRHPVESLVFTCLEYLRNHDPEFRKLSAGWETFEDIEWERLPGAPGDGGLPLTVFYLPCDIPLLAKEEVEFLFKGHDRTYDLQMGWSLRDGFERVIGSLSRSGFSFDRTKSKMNFSRFICRGRTVECRFNNSYGGKPLRLDPSIYLFFQGIYESRELIRKKSIHEAERKSLNPQRFAMLFRAFLRYLRARKEKIGNRVYGSGHFILNTYFHSLGLAGKNYPWLKLLMRSLGSQRRFPAEVCLDLRQIERNIRILTGNRIGMSLTNVVGPLLDVDTEYEYEFIKSHYRRLRDEIARYYDESGLLSAADFVSGKAERGLLKSNTD